MSTTADSTPELSTTDLATTDPEVPAATDTALSSGDGATPVPPPDGARRLTWLRIAVILGVLVPLAIMAWVASRSTPAFDGGMNLQVAQNLAQGQGFVREYNGIKPYPAEIQTSGIFVYLAAALIGVFGPSTFVFQLTNLLFIALLLVVVSLGLRRWPVLQIVGPSVVLFAVPGMRENAMAGYGEYVVAALVFAAFLLVDHGVRSRRPVWCAIGAMTLFGLALSVKVVAALALPVVLIGIVLLAAARRDVAWWKWPAALAGALLPLGINELMRFSTLGSAAYGAYWDEQFLEIGGQAGVAEGSTVNQGVKTPLLTTIGDHLHILSGLTGISSELWVLTIALIYVVLLALMIPRLRRFSTLMRRPRMLLAVQLAVYAGGYLLWWLALTPMSKTWLRRIAIGLLALAFLYLLLIGMVRDHLRERTTPLLSQRHGAWKFAAWAMAGLSAFVVALGGLATYRQSVVASIEQDPAWIRSVRLLADQSHELQRQGKTMYANGWWSAPVVALYGDLALGDLSKTEVCSPEANFAAGNSYLIWDFYALNLASTEPRSRFYTFEQIPGSDTGYGGIWKIVLRPGACPTK